MKNVLGNKISIGDQVGHSIKANGINTAFVGVVTGFTPKRVKIQVYKRAISSYDSSLILDTTERQNITAMANSLWPVDFDQVNWP